MKFIGYNLKREELFNFDTDEKSDEELQEFFDKFFNYEKLELINVVLEMEPKKNVTDFNQAIVKGNGDGIIANQKFYFNI